MDAQEPLRAVMDSDEWIVLVSIVSCMKDGDVIEAWGLQRMVTALAARMDAVLADSTPQEAH